MMKSWIYGICALALASVGIVHAANVYSWKSSNGLTVYSDTPRNLKLKGTNSLNVRTQTATPRTGKLPVPTSLADEQAQLSQKIALQNRQIEEQNAKVAAEMRQIKEENCRNAQSNRKLAESARNRDQIIAKYDADIAKNCN